MCRLTAIFSPSSPVLLADVVTRPRLSILYQSFNCREREYRETPRWAYEKSSLNADGFGIGWYMPKACRNMSAVPDAPCIFTSLKPAWSDRNLKRLAEKIISPLIFAHVRAAGPGTGESTELNCHPYSYGRFMFMHNGLVGEWSRVRRRFLSILPQELFEFCMVNGTTDTIALFALFLSLLDRGVMYEYPALYLRAKLEQTIGIVCRILLEEGVKEPTLLNIVATDGNHVIATRHALGGVDSTPSEASTSTTTQQSSSVSASEEDDEFVSLVGASLYLATGSKWERQGPNSDDFRMEHYDKRNGVAIVTSEPLTDCAEEWVPIPSNHILVLTSTLEVLLDRIRLVPDLSPSFLAPPVSRSHGAFGRALSFLADQPETTNDEFGGVKSRRVSKLEIDVDKSVYEPLEVLRLDTPLVNCNHSLHGDPNDPILCVATITLPVDSSVGRHHESHLVASGSRLGFLRIWHLETHIGYCVARAHCGGVLSLAPFVSSPSRFLLLSGGSDTSIAVWDLSDVLGAFVNELPREVEPLHPILRIKFRPIQGDVLSLTIHNATDSNNASDSKPLKDQSPYLYVGFQNTTIGFLEMASLLEFASLLEQQTSASATDPSVTLTRNSKRFQGSLLGPDDAPVASLACGILPYGPSHRHVGFVETLVPCGSLMVSGGGDGQILLWSRRKHVASLAGHRSGILCLAADPSHMTVYSGSRDSTIREWDLEVRSCLSTLKGHAGAVMAVELTERLLVSSSDVGEVFVWSRVDRCVAMSLTENDAPQRSAATALGLYRGGGRLTVASAGGDGILRLWKVDDARCGGRIPPAVERDTASRPALSSDVEGLLRELVSLRSVSGDPSCLDACYCAARCIAAALEEVGATVRICSSAPGRAPVVIGRVGTDRKKPTVVLYSHYDVVPAGSTSEGGWAPWRSNPWELTCKDGYYYGRGVSDNKGPLVAQIIGGMPIDKNKGLPVNIVWVSEGEEESGSVGFEKIIRDNREILVDASCVICTNSYWLNDSQPCIVYGMRGVMDIRLEVSGGDESTGHHSGFHGGAIAEPMVDLVQLLAGCTDERGDLAVSLWPQDHKGDSQEEMDRLDVCAGAMGVERYSSSVKKAALRTNDAARLLQKRWLEPAVSITEVWATTQQAGGAAEGLNYKMGGTFRVISSRAFANISVRLASGQLPVRSFEVIKSHLTRIFETRNSGNRLTVTLMNAHQAWRGDTESAVFSAAIKALRDVWDVDPLLIREGGTMPVISFLQDFLGVPAVQIPLGQSSDAAHLPNERIRRLNLQRGIQVLQNIFENLR